MRALRRTSDVHALRCTSNVRALRFGVGRGCLHMQRNAQPRAFLCRQSHHVYVFNVAKVYATAVLRGVQSAGQQNLVNQRVQLANAACQLGFERGAGGLLGQL